jgi:hypothetical protein
MTKIHYFQRYSAPENAVTNNTLQLIARIYDYSPSKASELLTRITGEQVDIGIEINQQARARESVPDGVILQRSFKILIETKVDAAVDMGQLLSHAKAFSNESTRVLILLTRQRLPQDVAAGIRRQMAEIPHVVFSNVTYSEICDTVTDLFEDYESEISSLVQDYLEYCNDTGLNDRSGFLMRILPCGASIEINKKYGICFHPSDRGYTEHAYVGVYTNKVVECLWAVDSVFDVEYSDNLLRKNLVRGRDTDDYDDSIISVIREAKTVCGYQIETGHRFFCGVPLETHFRKESRYGILGARFIDLRDFVPAFSNASDLADKLRDRSWS